MPKKLISFFARYWVILLGMLLAIVSLRDIMPAYNHYWSDPDGYYTHAPLVPLVIIYMIWKNRFRLGRLENRGSWIGVLVMLAGAIWVLSASVIQAETLAGPGILLLFWGIVWAMLEYKAARVLLFPTLFLYTVIPLPPGMLDGPTGRMQLVSTKIAAGIMKLGGVAVERTGNIIQSASLPSSLQVAGVCSGLKLLISALMFAFLFAYIAKSEWWKKVLLVVLAFPLSILVNSIRVAAIGFGGVWTYNESIMSKVHDYSATPALVLCFLLFFLFARLMKVNQYHDFDESLQNPELPPKVTFNAKTGVSLVLLAAAVLYASLVADLNEVPKGSLDPAAMPVSFGTWVSEEAMVDDDTLEKLAKADLLSRFYVNVEGDEAPVLVFISTAIDPIALHDPHTCLPGGGLKIVGEERITLQFTEPTPRSVVASLMTTKDSFNHKGFVLHWYEDTDSTYSNTRSMNIGYFKRRLGDLKQVFIRPFAVEQIKDEVFSRQIRWYRFSAEEQSGASLELIERFIAEFIAAGR